MVKLIKGYYLDSYENYLIRNLHSDQFGGPDRTKLHKHLLIYYNFLATFDLIPNVTDLTDLDILGHRLIENNDYYLSGKYTNQYQEQKNKLKQSEKTQITRQIVNIVKDATTANIQKLNQALMEILELDFNFRDELLRSRCKLLENNTNYLPEPE